MRISKPWQPDPHAVRMQGEEVELRPARYAAPRRRREERVVSDQGGWGGQTPPDYQQQQQYQQQQSPQYQQPGGYPSPGPGYGPQGQLEEAPSGLLSMILGILGLFTIPLVLSIAAIVLGKQAQKAAREEPYRYKDTFSKVGIITGWVGIALVILGVLFAIVVFGLLFTSGSFTTNLD